MERLWFECFGRDGGLRLVLASTSPRRQQLLRGMGFEFRVMSLDVDESIDAGISPQDAAIALSRRKAEALDEALCDSRTVFITADTVVAHEGVVLGKPLDEAEARSMLSRLSGAAHEVFTGVTLRREGHYRSFTGASKVWFAHLSESEIEYYVRNFRPYDKAGSYGIQEWIGYIGIERIEGSFYNVMGLPTHRLFEELKAGI